MPSLGSDANHTERDRAAFAANQATARGRELLREGRERERAGEMAQAIERYSAAIAAAETGGDSAVLAEALRRLGIVYQQRDESPRAQELCRRSYDVACRLGDDVLAAEALNTIGGLHLTTGALDEARSSLLRALELGATSRELRARVQQNLGILANIQGDLDEAVARYERSLAAYRDCGDLHGCAITYHNLGMVSTDRGHFTAAECYFRESRALAERTGDAYLQGLCLVNNAEVDLARQRFENAREGAEEALALFDKLGARAPKADAYRVIGAVYRETGRPALAEARLRTAIDLAVAAGSVLSEAEARRELALLYQLMGRNQEALGLLNAAHRLFRRLDARVDLVYVAGKMAELQGAYLAVIREWGTSIESSDSGTFRHSERVARLAVEVARALGLDERAETTILYGAYLHDVGKVRVPHEILHKPGPLTPAELEVMRKHPIWGVELLASIEFPWDLNPIIRWHHERYDGSGYPDGLKGDEIPVAAQVVGIADAYDALITGRFDKPPLTPAEALERITWCRHWWSAPVFEAFRQAMGGGGRGPVTGEAQQPG
ncbi:MAG TPA: HD domain-containing phosphohydrolase [Gemmatimonadales bacterium]|nr:HD domain-containing phosphohydrolase [Gemmatimonadales bacterium]